MDSGFGRLGVSPDICAKAEKNSKFGPDGSFIYTLSGYVDTSANGNFGTGNANMPPYKFGGPSKADGFNLDVVQLRIGKTVG